MKFHEAIAFRSHLQVATTATFRAFNNSFDFQPLCYIFEQTSSFELHMQLYAQQHSATVLLGTIWLQCRGYFFNRNKTNFNAGMYDEDLSCERGNFGWTGSETCKQCNYSSAKPMWPLQHVVQPSVLLPTTTYQHVHFASIRISTVSTLTLGN